ncbi:MAG TPA: hypothetical protein VFW85_01480 [Gaiellaceae bacterium]|nr:hypothetical protein [Gaiellaceae bacterium]
MPYAETEPARAPAAQPPGWNGEPSGEPGVHGVPRARRWDAVATIDAPGLEGDEQQFVVLADGAVVAESGEHDERLQPLVESLQTRLAPPYRAEAVRRGETRWAVAGVRIATVEARGLRGDTAELVTSREGTTLHVDGRPSFGSAPALERVGEVVGSEYVVRAKRLQDDVWEVDASPL